MFNFESNLSQGANAINATAIATSIVAVVVPFVLKLVAIFVVWFVGAKLIKVVRKILKKALEKSGADLGLVTFLDNFAKLGMYALLVVIILGMFDVDMASIAAVIASAGVAVGLALQGSLSNLAGGVLIILLKPFKVGDYIVSALPVRNINDKLAIFSHNGMGKKIDLTEYDIIFVDECSTIGNRTMQTFLEKMSTDTFLVLAGDIHQIESIDFGNWFLYAKDIIKTNGANVELRNTWRTEDQQLINL